METNLYGSICLSDIPKELIVTAKNGKKYLNIQVNARREVSQYGMTHYIKAATRKEQRREGVNYYIGELKPSLYQGDGQQPMNAPAPAPSATTPPASPYPPTSDNLPF